VYGLAIEQAKSHEVHVFDVPRFNQPDIVEEVNSVFVHRYTNTGKHNVSAITRLDEILRDIEALKPDCIHIHGTGEISAKPYIYLKKLGYKVLLTVHGILYVEKKNLLRKKFSLKALYQFITQTRVECNVLSKADKIIVDTEYVAVQLRDMHKKRMIKNLPEMYVIPQGINEVYLTLNPKPEDKTLLVIGSISERKGHLFTLKAFEKVCERIPDAKLIIAGVLSDKRYYDTMVNYIESSPCKDNIQLMVNLPQEELYSLYERGKIFALHSQEESQGIVFAEAMAVGLPVVATNVGGVPYVVHDKENGLLSNYADVETFANNLSKLLSDGEMCLQMAQKNKLEAINYKWSTIADRILELYNTL
jgi:glycosyltransferase involved in cell wall biosynthesis